MFELSDGQHIEVFGRQDSGKDHLETGQVVGFEVTDLAQAVAELGAGIELVGEPGGSRLGIVLSPSPLTN